MESKGELKDIELKNRTCYHFDEIIRFWYRDINFADILSDEILYKEKYKNILIYGIFIQNFNDCKTTAY